MLGIGDIENSSFDKTNGMGHAGLALSSSRFFYQANPASFSSLDDHFFAFEASARYKGVTYSGSAINTTGDQSSDLQFKKIALAIKIKPRWAVSAGILPYSTSNYSLSAQKYIQGTNASVPAVYTGTGGLSQFYVTNSYRVSKHFSVGLQASYLFGTLQQTEAIFTDSTLITTNNIFVGNPYFKLGMQYKTKVNKNLSIAAGGTASTQTKLRANYTMNVTYGNTQLVTNDLYKGNYYTIPLNLAGGLAAIIKDKYTIAFDYGFQKWSDNNISGPGYQLVNSSTYSGGFEYARKLRFTDAATKEVYSIDRFFYQAGLFYNASYLKLYGQQLENYGLTLGFGLNSLRNNLGLQFNVEVGQRGTTSYGLVKENYTQVSVTISYRDRWFTKIKRYN
ncbi:hypothetical protein F5148DRAFT_1296272 [Russula earlei]|uniref:Uncharacterized protein n=1 Tax=Russula earlei TaxID=71964 RepID=A0ACC0TQQ9_9AGAM|nr:hypothetical protein F5148DRAFT_1296272 [Russula earlei]